MTEIEREKYVRLMSEIENLEEEIHAVEVTPAPGDHAAASSRQPELVALRERLAERMRELSRVTDGCTRPRAMR